MWYTLVRFREGPTNITGVSQAKTAADALQQLENWERLYPDDTTVVFDPKNAPIQRTALVEAAGESGAAAGGR
jgi:hypothetical protein